MDNDRIIYLDHAALTPPRPELFEDDRQPRWAASLNPHAANRFSEDLLRAIKKSERDLLNHLGISEFEAEVVWTSGGTEANNLAVLGCLQSHRKPISLIESTAHKALLTPAQNWAENQGGQCLTVPADQQGRLLWERMPATSAANGVLAGVCHVNNETGAIQDLVKIREWLRRNAPDAYFMVDALQSFTKIDIPWQAATIDLLSIGGRKIGGPGHVGALIFRRGTPLLPLMFGGDQQRGLRPGTLDAPGILDFMKVVNRAWPQKAAHYKHVLGLNQYLRQHLSESWDGPTPTIVSPAAGSPYILNIAFPGCEGAVLVRALARKNIVIGAGSACSAEAAGLSHVMEAMKIPVKTSRGVLRVSFNYDNSTEDIDQFLTALRQVIKDY